MSLALRGISTPLLFCDIDPRCRNVLNSRMRSGELPEVPVVEDVRDTAAILKAVGGRRVDLLVSTSSCVGFSSVGKRMGLENPETGLFLDTLRLIERLRAPLVFMENVGSILVCNESRDYAAILAKFSDMGYDLAWGVFTAEGIGAWHLRRRWYALAVRRDVPLSTLRLSGSYGWYDWSRFASEKMMIPTDRVGKDGRDRHEMLGNAVVPDCARVAFLYLWSRAELSSLHKIRAVESVVIRPDTNKAAVPDWREGAPFPVFGESRSGKVYSLPVPDFASARQFGNVEFVLDPDVVTASDRRSPEYRQQSHGRQLVTRAQIYTRYATPRFHNTNWCIKLTNRCCTDLPSQLRFARHIPDELRDGRVNPAFLEFLMGFPDGWTKPSKKEP